MAYDTTYDMTIHFITSPLTSVVIKIKSSLEGIEPSSIG